MNRKTDFKVIASLISIFLILSACDEKAFNFVLNLDDTYEYTIIDDGVFSESTEISRDDVLSDIDIESDAEIEDVNIESIAVTIEELAGNAATSVSVNGFIYPDGDTDKEPLVVFQNLIINGEVASQLQAITQLNSSGINALAEKFKGYINESDFEDFVVEISGNSIPDGSRIEAKVELKIRATVKFKESLEVPFFVGDE